MRTLLLVSLLSVRLIASAPEIALNSKTVKQGQVALLRLALKKDGAWPADMAAKFGDQNITFWQCKGKKPGTHARCGLVAIPVDYAPGEAVVNVVWSADGKPVEHPMPLKVVKAKFKINHLKVDPNLTNPSPEEQARAAAEKEEIAAAYALGSPTPLWTDVFHAPTSGGVTSRFGNHRLYNGETKSVHFGVDLRANEKTPIRSTNVGKVLLAKNFFYAGNMVLLDHGSGIFSSYSHLSSLDVQPGMEVVRGQKLGMAGATGRVTGPHLHWSAKVNGVPVDPQHLQTVLNATL